MHLKRMEIIKKKVCSHITGGYVFFVQQQQKRRPLQQNVK